MKKNNFYKKAGLILAVVTGTWIQASAQKDTLASGENNVWPKDTLISYPKDTIVTGGKNYFPKDTLVISENNGVTKDTLITYPKDTAVTGGNNDLPTDTLVTDGNNGNPTDTIISKGIRYDLVGSGNLIAPIIKYGNYAWYYKDTLISDSTNHTFRPKKKGKYKVVVTWDNATANMRTAEISSVTYEFEVTQLPVPLGFENSNILNEINSVYPNPASEVAFINAKGTFEYSIETANTELISSGTGNELVRLDLRGMNAGIYFVRIKSNEKQTVRRLVVR